ncbi:hypothetical protein Taro_041373 [Colocasia esculenta]|uniref:Uncharacterized protein n=1 Tax=Colocasia esculenta TaxID=4460 RepID=A0A843WFN0_COLES|nr:hypothetical protein [Colocasia esculenta]
MSEEKAANAIGMSHYIRSWKQHTGRIYKTITPQYYNIIINSSIRCLLNPEKFTMDIHKVVPEAIYIDPMVT